jgi:hypothetical protein
MEIQEKRIEKIEEEVERMKLKLGPIQIFVSVADGNEFNLIEVIE